ncbi:MAG: Ig-like domain-containing protein, partial [Bryocella sp.]
MRTFRFLALLFIALSPASLMAQATIHVGSGQTYTTIQSGINAASDGDTVLVSPGTYKENIDFKTKPILITTDAGSGPQPATTIIDGSGLGPVVILSNIPPTHTLLTPGIRGFTIQNGGIPQTSGGLQGAISISGGGTTFLSISHNIIKNNFCQSINIAGPSVSITSNEIELTTAPSTCPAGEGKGSAIYITGSSDVSIIAANTIENNTASVAASSDKGGGAGINIAGISRSDIFNNIIRNNTTTGYGGGIYYANVPKIYLNNNLIYGNKGISGGVDIVVPGSSVGPVVGFIANNTIAENSGIGTTASVASDLFIGGNLAQYVVINNIIVGYVNGQSAVNCAAQYSSQTLTPLVFDHNDVYSIPSSTNKPFGGVCTSPAGTFGNISVDPSFKSATAAALTAGTSDFHLQTGSPAIDTGNNDALTSPYVISLDMDNHVIPQDATGVGYAIIDMGAYEASSGAVNPPAPALALTPDAYTYTAGQTATLTASFYAQPPTGGDSAGGTVTFYEDGASIGTVTVPGVTILTLSTTFTTAPLTQGIHSFNAIFSANAPELPSAS